MLWTSAFSRLCRWQWKRKSSPMRIDKNKLERYIHEERIMEISSSEECMNYLNACGDMQFQSTDEMKEVQKEYGFGIGDKWYPIRFQEALDIFTPSLPFQTEQIV